MRTVSELEQALERLEDLVPLVHDLCDDEDTKWMNLDQVIRLVRQRLGEAREAERLARKPARSVLAAVSEGAGFEVIPTPGARLGCSWYARR